jgi:hypothetical protein
MARMMPAAIDEATVSAAERRMFQLLKNDPATAGWIVLHSLGLPRTLVAVRGGNAQAS